MPILASTMVMPELIPVTYAKIRAELAAELAAGNRVTTLTIVADRTHMLVDADGRLPVIVPREGESIWAAAMREARERGVADAELLGWAGDRMVGPGQSALLLRSATREGAALAAGARFAPADELLMGKDAQLVRGVLQHEDLFGSC
jgi:hypothetical protein